MPTNPFVQPLGDNRSPAMSSPDLQSLRTPVSIGAQAIQRYLGNGAPRIANPNNVAPQGPVPNGFGGNLGDPTLQGGAPNGATPLGYTTTPAGQPNGSGSDATNMAAMGVSTQPSPGVAALRNFTAGYGADNGGTPNGSPMDAVNANAGPTQQTAAGGVTTPVRPLDWSTYFRTRMGPPRGGRAARAPLLMRQQRVDNGGY